MATVVKAKAMREPHPKKKFLSIDSQREPIPAATASAEGERYTMLSLKQLAAHPRNPRKHFDEEKLVSLAATIKEHGILQPLVVRPLTGAAGYYQIICGERRWRAAKIAEAAQIPAIVRALSDQQALELMIVENEERADLNAIELAEGINTLCLPTADGGAGLSAEQAGQRFGKSESWAKNLRRLLALPDAWKQRVVSGEMPQTFARELVPLVDAPNVLAAVDARLSAELRYRDGEWPTREEFVDLIDLEVRECSRPVEDDDKPYYDYRLGEKHSRFGRLFKLSDELRERLEIVTLPVAHNGKSVLRERALNCELFGELNEAAMKERIAKRAAKQNGKSTPETGAAEASAPSEKPTAADRAAKRQEQDEQLAKRIEAFRCRWLRSLMADELCPDKFAEGMAVYAWLANESHASYPLRSAWHNAYEQAVKEAGGGAGATYGGAYARPAAQVARKGEQAIEGVLLAQAGLTLFPDGSEPKSELPPLSDTEVELMADLLGCDLSEAWQSPSGESADWRKAFYELHNAAQLVDLGKELKVECWLEKTKAAMVELLGNASPKPPKSLLRKARK